MALTLHVDEVAWRAMVDEVWRSFPGLVPVVKGNGYGFGRTWLARMAVTLGAQEVAIGTVHELGGLEDLGVTTSVLTPSLDLDQVRVPDQVVLTVGSDAQVEHLLAHRPGGRVMVKIATSMHRHGLHADELPRVLARLASRGVGVHCLSIHPGLAASQDERQSEIESLLYLAPSGTVVSVSHLDAEHYGSLRSRHPDVPFRIRLGSALWHGEKGALRLSAKVLDVLDVAAGTTVGYRATAVPGSGAVVVVDAGSAHGVAPLADGRSPFHFARRRLDLLEPPHMHVSMVFVPAGTHCPSPGEHVDVQRPLLMTAADRIIWE